MYSFRERSVMTPHLLSPRPAKRGEGGERSEPGEGRLRLRRALSPPLRGDPLPQAGEGKGQRSSRSCSSIHILLIALLAFERRDSGFASLGCQGFDVGKGAYEGGTHILRHRVHVAADIEARAAVEPFDQIAALL